MAAALKRNRYSDSESDSGSRSENESDFDESCEANISPVHLDREMRKAIKVYASRVLSRVDQLGWDKEDIGRIMAVMIREMGCISEPDLLKFLSHVSCGGDPECLSKLCDDGAVISTQGKLIMLYDQVGKTSHEVHVEEHDFGDLNQNRLFTLIGRGCDVGLFDLSDRSTIQDIKSMLRLWFGASSSATKRLCLILCAQCNTKKQAGRVLEIFCKDMMQEEACRFIHTIVRQSYFYDLEGKMKIFWSQFSDGIGESAKSYFESNEKVSSNGELQDEDEDDRGNLIGFIDSSDDDFASESDRDSDENSSEEQENSDDTREKDEQQTAAANNPVKHETKKRQIVIGLSSDEEESNEEDETENSDDNDSDSDIVDKEERAGLSVAKSRKRKVIEDTDSDD